MMLYLDVEKQTHIGVFFASWLQDIFWIASLPNLLNMSERVSSDDGGGRLQREKEHFSVAGVFRWFWVIPC